MRLQGLEAAGSVQELAAPWLASWRELAGNMKGNTTGPGETLPTQEKEEQRNIEEHRKGEQSKEMEQSNEFFLLT